MKKLFTYLTVAMLCMCAASCQKETVVADGNGNVNFTIAAPGAATKALIGDGENVDIVYYEIYKNEAGHKNSVNGGTPLIKGSTKIIGKTASLSLNLLQDQDYVALFWAQVNVYGEQFYNTKDLRKVGVSYTTADGKAAPANDEDRAAFCQRHAFSTHSKQVNAERIDLVRPFAQINLGTTKESINLDYLVTLQESNMTIAGAGTVFDVNEMMATNAYTHVDYAFNAVPNQYLTVDIKDYVYAGMNYILVPANQSTVKLTYDIKTDVGTVNRSVVDVPVKMNHRTNLLGNLLTQESKFEIVIDNKFITDENVNVPN